MPVALQITNEDIEYAEHILLPFGGHFDQERIDFIKNYETLDLQAVPGSGKTTALLAKLLIIERYLPFDNGEGVLVISHTNAAVDEIRNKIEKYCPRLFDYPNFVGTIQAFVDEFLARPYYQYLYGDMPQRIDNDTYLSQFHRHCPYGARIALSARYKDLDGFLLKVSALEARDYIFDNLSDKEIVTFGKSTPTYQNLRNTKLELIREGHLNFNDAYCLARQCLEALPQMRSILCQRFGHVFVDEMQDMDSHQYDLLESLFADFNASGVCYQRIGDKNQAIFNGDAGNKNIWHDRATVLQLSGSHRLSSLIAEVVQSFAAHPILIEGRMRNADESDISIKPKIIVYDDATMSELIDSFISIIKELEIEGRLPISDPVYYAVAWNAKHSEGENGPRKLKLVDYYPSFARRINHGHRKDHGVLADCVIAPKGSRELKTIQDSLLRAILKVLSLEGIRSVESRGYTKRGLLKHLADNFLDEYEALKSNLYFWSMGVVRDQESEVIVQLKSYMPHILSLFNVSITSNSRPFIDGAATYQIATSEDNVAPVNVVSRDGIDVNVSTVHAVKGQTHTATLYLETYYFADGPRNGPRMSYESQRLVGQFRGEQLARNVGARVRQSAKMMYVGLSRPTHLACFAVHKDRFDPSYYSENWEIIDISESRGGRD